MGVMAGEDGLWIMNVMIAIGVRCGLVFCSFEH